MQQQRVQQQIVGTRPVLRVVTTSRCNLRCHYCPPDNENFPSSVVGKGSSHDINWEQLRHFVDIAFSLGIQRVSITGGEPLLSSAPVTFLIEYSRICPDRHWVLQTNGVFLRRYLTELTRVQNLTLKVSLDVFTRSAFKEVCGVDAFEEVVAAIRQARQLGLLVGINVVLTQQTVSHAQSLIQFARATGCYIKFLDVNWYADVGARSASLPVGEQYWRMHYVSPLTALQPILDAEGIGKLESRCNHSFGIPVFESPPTDSLFVRIKDSAAGTTYAPVCRACPHFVSRKCQEGIYELTLTPDFRLKLCRHRPDLEYHVDPGKFSDSEIIRIMRNIFVDIYESATHHELPKSNTNLQRE